MNGPNKAPFSTKPVPFGIVFDGGFDSDGPRAWNTFFYFKVLVFLCCRRHLGAFGVSLGSSRGHPEGIQGHQGASGRHSKVTWGVLGYGFYFFLDFWKNIFSEFILSPDFWV